MPVVSVCLLLISLLRSVLADTDSWCSLTNKTVLNYPELPTFNHCIDSNTYICDIFAERNDNLPLSTEFLTVINNETGLLSVKVPLFSVSSDHVTYSVTFYEASQQHDSFMMHQQYNFKSTGVNCSDKMEIRSAEVVLRSVWSGAYTLALSDYICNHLLSHNFSVTTGFSKPRPVGNRSHIELSVDSHNSTKLEIVFTYLTVFPPIHQLWISVYNKAVNANCDTLETASLVNIYINTTFAKSQTWVSCDKNQTTHCLNSLHKVTCHFNQFDSSKLAEYKGIVRLEQDIRCMQNYYDSFHNPRESCCIEKEVALKKSVSFDNTQPAYTVQAGDLWVYVAVFMLLVLLIAIILAFEKAFEKRAARPTSHLLLRKIGLDRSRPAEHTQKIVPRPTVLLLYAREGTHFIQVMSRLREVLSLYCEVKDCFDPAQYDDVVANVQGWSSKLLVDMTVRVVLVLTACSMGITSGQPLRYRSPAEFDQVFVQSFRHLQNLGFGNRNNVFVVRLEESLETSGFLLGLTFCLPIHLRRLVESLLNHQNLAVEPDSQLNQLIEEYNHHVKNTSDYKDLLFLPVVKT